MIPLRILLVEDHKLVREAWQSVLSSFPDYTIIAESESHEDAVLCAKAYKPDIILMDINLKGKSGLDAINEICDSVPNPRIIVVSMHTEIAIIKKAFFNGAKGYVTKNSSRNELIEAINTVANNDIFVCQEIKDRLILDSLSHQKEVVKLSIRELEIIRLICKANTNKEIASELNITEKTVEGYKTAIYRKTKTNNSIGIMNYALQNNIDVI